MSRVGKKTASREVGFFFFFWTVVVKVVLVVFEGEIRDRSSLMGIGGGGGGQVKLPLQKEGRKQVLAMLKGGHKKVLGNFNTEP